MNPPNANEATKLRIYEALLHIQSIIIAERDPEKLLQAICENIREKVGYSQVWLISLDSKGALYKAGQTGFDVTFPKFLEKLKVSEKLFCMNQALKAPGVAKIEDIQKCRGCPLKVEATGKTAKCITIRNGRDALGWLLVGYSKEFPSEEVENYFLEQLAGNLSVVLRHWREAEIEKEQSARLMEKFNAAFENNPDAISITTLESGEILDVNLSFCRATGYEKEEVIGKNALDLKIWQNSEQREEFIKKIKRDGRAENLEINFRGKYGQFIQSLMSSYAFRLGGQDCLLNIAKDITELRSAQNALKLQLETTRSYLDTSLDGFILADTKGNIVDVNTAYCKMTGYTREELLKMNINDLEKRLSPAEVEARIKMMTRDGFARFETQHRHKSGKPIELDVSIVVNEREGRPLVAAFVRDITEQKAAREELERSETRYRSVVENTGTAMLIINREGIIEYANRNCFAVTGYKPEKLIGTPWTQYVVPECLPFMLEYFEKRFKNPLSVPQTYETQMIHKNETVRNVLVNVGAIEPLQQVVVSLLDITDRKRIDTELKISEERYRDLFELSPVPLWEEDFTELLEFLHEAFEEPVSEERFEEYLRENPEFLTECADLIKVVEVNRAALKLHRAESKEALLQGLNQIFTESSLPVFKEEVKAVLQGKEGFESEAEVKTLDGETRDIFLKFFLKKPTTPAERAIALLVTMDITPLKKARAALEKSFREIRMLYALSQKLHLGMEFDRVIEEIISVLWQAVEPDVVLFYRLENGTLLLQESHFDSFAFNQEKARIHQIGVCLCGLAASQKKPIFSPDIHKDERCTLEECKEAGLSSLAALPLEAGDNILGVIAFGSIKPRDFEAQKGFLQTMANESAIGIQNVILMEQLRKHELELEKMVEERTAELQRVNRELEAFSYSVSHDLRAPLRAIDGFSRILQEDYGHRLDDEANRLIHTIRRNTARMSELIDDLLAFSRISRKELSESSVNISKIAQNVFQELLQESENSRVEFKCSQAPLVKVDPSLIRQVLTNLLSNAIKFSGREAQPQIRLDYRKNGSEIIFVVEDNGVGFNEKYADKLFKIFQRLHSETEFEGTGIGLSIVQRIITRHGGRVWAESQPGQGARFYFSLPAWRVLE
ncbi:MAG: hypothetical protein Kow0037_00350 [Calditrichia bacterium]